MNIQYLTMPDGARLAFEKIEGQDHGPNHHLNHHLNHRLGDQPVHHPGVIFLGGFMSDMTGTKAQDLAEDCRRTGRAFVRFDYFGHGASGGRFEDGTIGRWAQDAIYVLDHLTSGPQILVGSSMGGWLMVLAALARPERIRGLVGIAAAPDFTEDLFWTQLSASQRQQLTSEGVFYRSNAYGPPYPFTLQLIEESRQHLVLRGPIHLHQPVHLLHGLSDADVPWNVSVQLAQALISGNVSVTLMKGADHRFSGPDELAIIRQAVASVSA